MEIIAAAGMLLAALAVGLASFALLPLIKYKRESDKKDKDENKPRFMTELFRLFKEGSLKRWAVITVSAFLCSAVVYRLFCDEISAIELFKYSASALFFLSVMIIDAKTCLIPNKLILAFLGVGAAALVTEYILSAEKSLAPLFSGIIGLSCGLVLFYIISRLTKDGISMGDVKLIAASGWILGLSMALATVFLAMLICSVTAVFLLISKKKNKTDRIPFGPFMFFGYILMLMVFSF